MNTLETRIQQLESAFKKLTSPKPKEKTNVMIPGRTSPKITPQQIRGAGRIKSIGFTFSASTGLGTQDYTGFGFKPIGYSIYAWYNANHTGPAKSFSVYDGTNISGYYEYPSFQGSMSTRLIAVYTNASTRTRANHVSILNDGVRLDYINADIDAKFVITAWS